MQVSEGTVDVEYHVDGSRERIDFEDVFERCALPSAALAHELGYRRLRAAHAAEKARRREAPVSTRTAKVIAAAEEAGVEFSSRPFFDRTRSSTPRLTGVDLLVLDLFSGVKSVARSANARHGALAATVDVEHRLCPDSSVDFRVFNLWGFLRGNCKSRDGRLVWLPVHMHGSPQCQTFVNVSNEVNTRSAAEPEAGPTARPAAHVADACVRGLLFFISQFELHGLPTTFSVENPRASLLWRLAGVAAVAGRGGELPLRTVDVDYCCYGNCGQKPSRFAVSCCLRTDWARRCDGSGACGSMVVTSRTPGHAPTLEHLGPASHGPATAAIPDALCAGLVAAVVAHHAPRRLGDPHYAAVSVDFARAREAEWRQWVGSSAGASHHPV